MYELDLSSSNRSYSCVSVSLYSYTYTRKANVHVVYMHAIRIRMVKKNEKSIVHGFMPSSERGTRFCVPSTCHEMTRCLISNHVSDLPPSLLFFHHLLPCNLQGIFHRHPPKYTQLYFLVDRQAGNYYKYIWCRCCACTFFFPTKSKNLWRKVTRCLLARTRHAQISMQEQNFIFFRPYREVRDSNIQSYSVPTDAQTHLRCPLTKWSNQARGPTCRSAV